MIKVQYNSLAMPQEPYNVEVGAIYNCEKKGNLYLITGNNFKKEFSLNFIKKIFKPCDGYDWKMLK